MRKRVTIPQLREMDNTMLQVVTSDVLTMLMDFVDPGTMCDLLAISETSLPVQLQADFHGFAQQMHRDVADLPRGQVLATFLKDMGEVDPARVPDSFRSQVSDRKDDADAEPPSAAVFEELMESWIGTAFTPLDREGESRSMRVQMPDVPNSHKHPDERDRRRRSSTGSATKSGSRSSTAKPSVDPERDRWLRKSIVERLRQYEGKGLKESVLVAGTIRRCPFKNMTRSEVMSALRSMKREGGLRESTGRWSVKGRW